MAQSPVIGDDGGLIWLFDEQGGFLGTAYAGIQNKGIGWMIDRKKRMTVDADLFRALFKTAQSARQNLPDASTNAYRWFNGEGDGFGGLTIDRYDGFFVFTWYSRGCYAFVEKVMDAFKSTFGEYEGIYFKRRFDTGGQYLAGEDFYDGKRAESPFIIRENGLNFAVHLDDGPMVGIFLDQRHVRHAIKERYASGKDVLNTFSYTGAFSVAAYAGNARSTVSVDLANRSLPKTTEQFEVNGFGVDDNRIIVEDVFQYFKYAVRKELTFDLVILDPPSHAKSKKMIFAAEKNYTDLLEDAIRITRDEGIIVASTNCASFNMAEFKRMVDAAFKNCGNRYRILEMLGQPDDFKVAAEYPEGAYLKVIILKKN